MKQKIGLVLEGGGMRGLYTSGVLDYFLDENIYFPYIIGVSMGACNGASYISKQRGRNKSINIDYIEDKRYINYRGIFKNKSILGMDFLFDEIPNKLNPFDYKTFFNSKQDFVIVTTDCTTGNPVYYHKDECKDILKVIKASSSLPFISPIVEINGKKLLDGGISDSIPLKKAFEDGNDKLVVILTRDKEYIKKPFNHKFLANTVYLKYKNLVKAMFNRYKMYNETLKYLQKLERQGKIFIIRPKFPLEIKRMEKDKIKLEKLYNEGYNDVKACKNDLEKFLQL